MPPPKVFISYRREDCEVSAGWLYEKLEDHFGSQNIFFDVDTIPLGHNFVKYLDEQVSQCDVLLAMIGKGWLEAKDKNGAYRLQDENDFVRIEITSALKRDSITVIPVLVGGAKIPPEGALPPDIEELSLLNAARVRTGRDFRRDVDNLIKALDSMGRVTKAVAEKAKLQAAFDEFADKAKAKAVAKAKAQSAIVQKAIRKELNKPTGELTKANLEKVTSLALKGTKITDAGLKDVAKLKQLTNLDLKGTNITDAGLKKVAKLEKLTELRLVNTQTTDAGLKELAKMKQLTNLDLEHTQITDVGLKELAKMKQLEYLYLYYTKATKTGVAELQMALPNCQIYVEDHPAP